MDSRNATTLGLLRYVDQRYESGLFHPLQIAGYQFDDIGARFKGYLHGKLALCVHVNGLSANADNGVRSCETSHRYGGLADDTLVGRLRYFQEEL